MVQFLISVVAFLAAIGILVAVHEWGHFIVARLFGVKILRFSIGFGKPLWTRTSGVDDTEYCISAIPIGGYVKLLDERDCVVPPSERHRTFNAQPIGARVAVLMAGPLLNFAFAVLAYWFMFVVGVPGMRPVIGEIEPASIVARAGLEAGDEILRVGEREVATWEGTILALLDEMLAEGDTDVVVLGADGEQRQARLATSGRESEITEPGRLFEVLGLTPWSPVIEPVLDELESGGPAEEAGFRPGDRIVAADDTPIESWPQWRDYVRARPGEPISVRVRRDEREFEIDLLPAAVEEADATIGRMGASVRVPDGLYEDMRAVQRYGPAPALVAGARKTWEMGALTVRMVARMVTGDVSIKNISGPINIAQYAGYSAQIGLQPFLNFLAIVSISLGILNLLPIPMLDGGQIVYQVVEAAKGSPLSERTQLIGQQIGIVLLLLLMGFAFYNDLSRIFS